MNMERRAVQAASAAILAFFAAAAGVSAAAAEVKGAAILEHACGKTAVKQMGLVNGGNMAEAMKLGTPEMQKEWNAMPVEDRTMLTGMMKEMSVSSAQLSADIKAAGLLVVDGASATLTVKQEHEDANGSSTSTMTQQFKIDGKGCWISK
ncbi:MAG: hypothetical protein AAB011_03795 [Candidatus Eisenbacteria bacterium]